MPRNSILSIFGKTSKPPLFEPGEPKFWDDLHISNSMLEAHLDQTHNEASRKNAEIEKTIHHLTASGILKAGDRVLDLGCGPGLYSNRLCQKGMKLTCIDISPRSIDYARSQAKKDGLNIEYFCADFFNIEYEKIFDAVLQVYGEICTFPNEKRDLLLSLIYRALKDGGISFLMYLRGHFACGADTFYSNSSCRIWAFVFDQSLYRT